jgi:cyclomaltodextrinase / maltogenic alpha-amylase / neopullulanase
MWADDAYVYHVFPLGACGAERRNEPGTAVQHRLHLIAAELDHIQGMGANTLLLGPVFESSTHGYDTLDLRAVDRRLGSEDDLAQLAAEVHRRGMRLMFDAVFNHVGRDFFAFQDVRSNGVASQYADWFHLDPHGRSPVGDDFGYEGWAGNYELAKLDVDHPAVREYLFGALDLWVDRFGIDGLRLDAADVLTPSFLAAVAGRARSRRSDIWLVGEMVQGDYTLIAAPGLLDGATNYELYKSLWSAHHDRNYFEIAFALNRQFGPEGLYRDLKMYNFADNHDVDRVAGSVDESAHLFPLYGLLFTIPGAPSVYYGSEWGLDQRRSDVDDRMLRPSFAEVDRGRTDLVAAIGRLARVRAAVPALRHGDYAEVSVASEQMAFRRSFEGREVLVAVNMAAGPADVPIGREPGSELTDELNGDSLGVSGSGSVSVPGTWLRVLTPA